MGSLASTVFVAVVAFNLYANMDGEMRVSPNVALAEDAGWRSQPTDCPTSTYYVNVNTTMAYNAADAKTTNLIQDLHGYLTGTMSGSALISKWTAAAGLGGGVISNSLSTQSANQTRVASASARLGVAKVDCASGTSTCTATSCAGEQQALWTRVTQPPN